jgi:phosphoserine phosphatase
VAHGFQLCTLDLDGTLIRTTCFLEVAKAFGKEAEVRAHDERYFAGEETLAENFWAEYKLLEGIPVPEAQAALRKGPWLSRIPDGVATLRQLGLRVGLLTDQPRFLAEVAEPTLDPLLCSDGGVEAGRIAANLDYKEDKAANLRAWAKANKLDLERAIHCGNGSNDIPVFERVGLAIAVNPSEPGVARAADLTVEGVTDLRQVAEVVDRALREGA